MELPTDTIVAQATAPGRGGVGIVRVSGPLASTVALELLGKTLSPRKAEYLAFLDEDKQTLDQGIALFFNNPHSFTGEDVLELQGHGGQIILDLLIKRILKIANIRMARPGEFSERAFLNDKLDLAQAEAIADLIDASSVQAAKSAMRSLQGEFSAHIHQLVEKVIHLRMYVEAAIDFPEEEIDFLSDGKVANDLNDIITQMQNVKQQAKQGSLLREGMQVVIAGKPNAGKSSLLNALAGRDAAIVTDIAGTTRDVLKEHIHLDGMPLHIIDTAGLRESADKVEQIGIQRAWQEIQKADRVLFMLDSCESAENDPHKIWPEFMQKLPKNMGLTLVRNKVDLSGESVGFEQHGDTPVYRLSASLNQGVDALAEHLKQCMGFDQSSEGQFIARRRHLDAIERAAEHLEIGQQQLHDHIAGEILAEELRLTQQALNEITGEFSSDDLLGRIFSSFCIGK
ncbi:tRNA uridine-5-carboxymethylaminomethyl(34) synthesis GTPase MnmE [Aliiglaciecola sp. 3_MG-2023]|uniref:tRNA uridine-5-carboxymethylaminomethyl(34) synthesis GTPase MnmE n=1 Tax=Aliiglaciecola sp. 3_MG-2023 TaxID=3062644 RepID=UPI0026E33956|nr:tRNA uridine-5-carboxymethylaminomethyl(34) synthesis GTPase MnmE [Aliiglaciecola sp. 3_MG-2023]MDO6695624.1 tRNA uridine-5-carboxymethylaminomethyl(34) synthesis GTPase MnmE [Aliiglaciecola sp. 3_MG-2023]